MTFVAKRIRRYYGREAEVLHPPVDTDFFTPGGESRGDYVLAVAALAPYKRAGLAVAACERLGLELRIVGEGPEAERLAREPGPRVMLLGRVDGGMRPHPTWSACCPGGRYRRRNNGRRGGDPAGRPYKSWMCVI